MKKAVGSFNQEFAFVVSTALAMFVVKLYFSSCVYGTNDISSWISFAAFIEKYGTFKIYPMIRIYNHPPLMSWYLKLVVLLCRETRLSFPCLFRLLPITADFLSIVVIWRLLEVYTVKNKFFICLFCALNPVNFLISGFHGNTDPVFVFMILCSFYLIERDQIVFAGLIYGLSICIKIVPVIFIPAFLYYLNGKERKSTFLFSFVLAPLVVYLPYLAYGFYYVVRNIFLYNSIAGIWGVGHLLDLIFKTTGIPVPLKHFLFSFFLSYRSNFKFIFFAVDSLLIIFLTRCRKLNLMELAFLTISLFLVLTPGFGVQYLSWLSFFAISIFPVVGSVYALLGGMFLCRIYAYWGGGKAPYFANSNNIGQWVGFDVVLDIILWLLIVVMLLKFIYDKRARSNA